MWKLQSSLFAASQGLEWLAVIAVIGAIALLATRIAKRKETGELDWATPLLICLMGACLYGASLLTLRSSNRVLKSNVIDLYNDLEKFVKERTASQMQQEGETKRHYLERITSENRATQQQYHEQFVPKLTYAREQLQLRDVHDGDLDHFLAEDPSSPFTLELLAARLELISRQL